MFQKILIANRGEIACRIIKTCQKMGIKTVAVYSDADANALHVKMADEAVRLGPAPSHESYLCIDQLIRACQQTQAQAVHPGYGFLSENCQFAQALADENITFIGPPSGAIEAMGDKITSKKLAKEAGVPTVPGYMGLIEDEEHAIQIARDIGYPVMIKASAGGGGKGMRVAYDDEQAREGFARSKSEALSSFGDDRIFIEKFIEQPRHIEIQVLADTFGHTVYLAERECSIQRRHQKIIEEAPCAFLDEKTRKAMGERSCDLAKAVNYCSAGTVEFIVDQNRNFYFLEMNTRLQVEHPVTEKIVNQDLVQWMIRIAAGEKLPLKQSQIQIKGWAMESRIYAEDPFRDFLPSTGRLVAYREPLASEHVRVDSGVYEGGEISMYYDPMISKLVTYGENRNQAIELMRQALDAYYIRGINHNIAFLSSVYAHPKFASADLSTNFISEEYPDGFSRKEMVCEDIKLLCALACWMHCKEVEWSFDIDGQYQDDMAFQIDERWCVVHGQQTYEAVVSFEQGRVHVDGQAYDIQSQWLRGMRLFCVHINGQDCWVQMKSLPTGYELSYRGFTGSFHVYRPDILPLVAYMPERKELDMSMFLQSPMPGLLVSLAVKEGQKVKVGQELCVLEAMKMENVLKAHSEGVVKTCHAQAGDLLSVDQIIIEFEV